MHTVLQVIHVIDAFVLILIVLLQQGKGAGMGLAFGGSSQTVFGTGAGNFLTKVTAWAAVIFMATSLGLAYLSGRSGSSVMRSVQAPAAAQKAPAGAVTGTTSSATTAAAPKPVTK